MSDALEIQMSKTDVAALWRSMALAESKLKMDVRQ